MEVAEKHSKTEPGDSRGASGNWPFHSAGQRIHNEITYRGIDWLLNSSIGVAFTYWQARMPSGEKYFGKPVRSFFNTILKPVLKNPAALTEGSKWGTALVGILAGGTAIIPAMMAMENKKVKKGVVRWLDEKIYGREKVARDLQFQEAYEAIDNEPEKDFATGMISRLISITPMLVVSAWPTTNSILTKYAYKPIGSLTKWCAESIGIKPKHMINNGTFEHIDANPALPKEWVNNWDFMHRLIGFDFGLTIIYSFLHEMSYKALCKLKRQPADKQPAEQPQSALPIAEPIPAEDTPRPHYTHKIKQTGEYGHLAALANQQATLQDNTISI